MYFGYIWFICILNIVLTVLPFTVFQVSWLYLEIEYSYTSYMLWYFCFSSNSSVQVVLWTITFNTIQWLFGLYDTCTCQWYFESTQYACQWNLEVYSSLKASVLSLDNTVKVYQFSGDLDCSYCKRHTEYRREYQTRVAVLINLLEQIRNICKYCVLVYI